MSPSFSGRRFFVGIRLLIARREKLDVLALEVIVQVLEGDVAGGVVSDLARKGVSDGTEQMELKESRLER